MKDGQLFELQQDNTYSLYQIKFNIEDDTNNGKYYDDQIPNLKKLSSTGHIFQKQCDENETDTKTSKKKGGFIKNLFKLF